MVHARRGPVSRWETTSAENHGNHDGITGSTAFLLPGVLGTSLGLSQLSNIYSLQSQKEGVIVMEFHPRTAICQFLTFSLTFSDSFQVFVSWHLFLLPAIRKLHFWLFFSRQLQYSLPAESLAFDFSAWRPNLVILLGWYSSLHSHGGSHCRPACHFISKLLAHLAGH